MQSDAVETVTALAWCAESRCGDAVVIGIDGPSGSGKTTLAEAIRGRLDCPVIHMDDLFPGWDGLAQASLRLTDQVLGPLAVGEPAGYRRWDWIASGWAERIEVPPTPLLIVEGCASTVRPAGDYVAVRVWMEAAHDVRMHRGIERDGETYLPHWERWAAQERELFSADGTRERADLIVRT
ncbi:MAG: 4-amino-4-deoxy-L-arabinose transferase [Micropruina sp.]